MKIFLVCSKKFYDKVPDIKAELETLGHQLTLPNCFEDPTTEDRIRELGPKKHSEWKSEMLRHSTGKIAKNDAILVLNFEKNGIKNYIGGATFLEMYDAFKLNKKIFLYNPAPQGILYDEIVGFDPIVLNADISKIC